LAKKQDKARFSDPLLPTVNEPGTYEWCEEVVECMNAAWRGRETSEQGFLAAVAAAVQFRIWETLSPPPPQEPYASLDNMVRRTADPGQAENMQLVIRFSGVADEAQAARGADDAPPWETRSGAAQASAAYTPTGDEVDAPIAASDDAEVALGERLLEQFAAMMAGQEGEPEGDRRPVGIPAGISAAVPSGVPTQRIALAQPRVSPAQRKREKLEQTRPDLIDAVQAGEMTLKQAYIESGIEKQAPVIDKLQKLWRNASSEERERFLAWLDQQAHEQEKREYQEEVYGEDA
jgi:hypothetical protein